jgi:fatty acid desaturase
MISLGVADPTQAPSYKNTWLQRTLLNIVRDPRDVVFLRLALKGILVMGSFAVLWFFAFSWWYAVPFALAHFLLTPPTILMLHCAMHRPLVKQPRWIATALPYVMAFLFMIPCGYKEHHVGMHHPENNLEDDLSSTMGYQRDRFTHFLHYFARFFFLIYAELPMYFLRKGRRKLAVRSVSMELIQVACILLALALNWRAAVSFMVIPFVFVRFMMMAGNWGQHAFIDAAEPGNSLRNSINCIDSRYNAIAFNDGYHIVHHEKPNLHWTEMPGYFQQHHKRYGRDGAIVFRELDFFVVSLLLWTGRYEALARKWVTLDGAEPSLEDRVAFLKSRVQPVTRTVHALREAA